MSGRRESRGNDERALLAPGRGADGGGDDDDRRGRMPGCLGLFACWKKKRAPAGRVAAAPPPPPRPPARAQAQEVKELPPEIEVAEVKELPSEIVVAEVKELPSEIEARDLPAEIDCLIVSKLTSIYDRSSLQGVCGRWRNATLSCTAAPLPLIINADFTLSNYFAEGADCVPQKMNSLIKHMAGHPSTCLGSLDNWIAIAYEAPFDPQTNLYPIHNECCLVQPIKGRKVSLPSPSSFQCRGSSGSLQLLDGDDTFTYYQPARECRIWLQNVAIHQSSGLLDFKIAALATQRAQHHIVFCTVECNSWTISSARFITIGSDIEFFQEKLFVLGSNQAELFMIEFGPHLCMFPRVTQVQRCGAVDPPVLNNTVQQKNLVRSEEHLLLVVRYFSLDWDQLTAVRVFQFDADSLTWTEKQSIGSNSILISVSSSECIDASCHKEISSNHIYFLDHFCPGFLPVDGQHFSYRSQVYSLQSGAITEHLIGRAPASQRPGYPMWFCPSD